MGVLEEREEQLLGEVQSTSCGTTLLKSKQPTHLSLPQKKKLNPGPRVEAEGAARRKAEARALEAEGRVQVL